MLHGRLLLILESSCGPERCNWVRLLVPLLLLAAACSPTGATIVTQIDGGSAPIRISMSLYVVDDADGGPGSPLSSQRSLSDIDKIAERVTAIWEQAGIDLTIESVSRIEAPAGVLIDLRQGDTSSFLNGAVAGAITISGPATINGFYVARIGTANGMTPLGTRLFFVTDDPSVNDERVSSHEIGHILGLHHALDDAGRLMFSGTNGTNLTDQEVNAARYGASGILDGVR